MTVGMAFGDAAHSGRITASMMILRPLISADTFCHCSTSSRARFSSAAKRFSTSAIPSSLCRSADYSASPVRA